MTRVGLVANPTAGSGKGADAAVATRSELAFRGCEVVELSGPSWGEALGACQDAAPSLDALVVVGGDGMVHLGVQVCGGTELPLGIVAVGSGNDFATAARMPLGDVKAAVAAIVSTLESPRRVDLGLITFEDGTQRYFAGVLSAGIDAAVAERGRRMKIPRGAVKYKAAVGLELPRFRPYGVRVLAYEQDSSVVDENGAWTLIAVSNSGLLGGGIPMSPESSLTDGRLELVRAEPLTRRAILGIFPRLLKGTHIGDPRVHVNPVTTVRLTPGEQGTQPPVASADGEAVGHLPARVTTAPGALHLLGSRAH